MRKSRLPDELKDMWLLSSSFVNQIGIQMRIEQRKSEKPNFALRGYLEDLRATIDSYLGAGDM